MKGRMFIDTNVFVYLYSEDEIEKRNVAIDFLSKHKCVTSIQVLNELSNVLIRKFNIIEKEMIDVLDEIEKLCVIYPITIDSIKNAINIKERYKYSYYDSLIVSVASMNDCDYLISEDMNSGQNIKGVMKIKNIF